MDTIVAAATAFLESGISIVRVSGEDAVSIVDKVFRSKAGKSILCKMKSHTLQYGFIYDGQEIVDEVLVSFMKGPRSYTKEDVVEVHCHGSIYIVQRIILLLLRSGARTADPGEFTKRAFLNGRIDLSQAEAVMDMIQSKNELSLRNAVTLLSGGLYDKVRQIRELVLQDMAYIEAALDDPEHISLEGFLDICKMHVDICKNDIKQLMDSYDQGRIIKEGIQTIILGKPNVGKSSLMNYFTKEDSSIVTDIAGTTRDVIEADVRMDYIHLRLMDTAGIHDTENVVEKIGVEKAMQIAEDADLILYMIDSTVSEDERDIEILEHFRNKKIIILFNKIDLEGSIDHYDYIKSIGRSILKISIKENKGLELLKREIENLFITGSIYSDHDMYITNIRQLGCLTAAYRYLEHLEEGIREEVPEDFFTIDLSGCYEELGRMIGEEIEDDLVDKIFSEFCMGK